MHLAGHAEAEAIGGPAQQSRDNEREGSNNLHGIGRDIMILSMLGLQSNLRMRDGSDL